jgi:hypothetical protein
MEVLMGKSSVNGPFSIAMLNNQRVYIYTMISQFKELDHLDPLDWQNLAEHVFLQR